MISFSLLSVLPTCGGWNENIPSRLIYLNAYFPVDGIAWKVLGSMAFWEEVCHCDWALAFQTSMPFLISVLCLILADKDVNSLSTATFPTVMTLDPLQLLHVFFL